VKKLIFFLAFVVIVHCTLKIDNCSAQWVQMGNGITENYILTLAANGNNVFAGTANLHGIFKSTNNGVNWNQTSLNNQNITSLLVSNNTIYAGTNNGIFISNNNGFTWTQTGAYIQNILSLAANGSNIYAGSNYNGVYKSIDNGISWIQTTLNNQAIFSLLISGNNIFAGSNGFGIYLSTDNGTSWTNTGLNNKPIISFAIIGTNIFAGTALSGVYLTTNNGISWNQTNLTDKVVNSLTAIGNNLFAGIQNSPTDSGGVYLSTNNGLSWIKKNQGFNSIIAVQSLLILNDNIFAGTNVQSVWRRPLLEIIGIQNISTEIPSSFSLGQNYPNPFNSMTKIKFDIPSSGFPIKTFGNDKVVLKVFDILGKEIATLVNESALGGHPGTYEVTFDASMLTSGVYFYRLSVHQGGSTTGDFSETKKMLLLK
jgi:hypothetical protein